MSAHDTRGAAEAQILKELVDTLFAERIFDTADTEFSGDGTVWRWWLSRAQGRYVDVLTRCGIVQDVEMEPNSSPRLIEADKEAPLNADDLMQLVGQHMLTAPDQARGVTLFREMLADATVKAAASLSGAVRPDASVMDEASATFLALERWASLRDRPFHPVGKAKQGFDDADYRRYMAEFRAEMTLDWIAVSHDALRLGEGASLDRPPAVSLLDPGESEAIGKEMRARGLDASHVAIPLHPWQRENAIGRYLEDAMGSGRCIPLETRVGRFAATSSLRSLAPIGPGAAHLKLPLAVHSLAASRYLPAVKMINGQRSERLLRQALMRDSTLLQQVFLCEESDWWAYFPEGTSLYDEAPRHLSAMVRRYPTALVEDPDCHLVPMAALGVTDPAWHYFDVWLHELGQPPSAEGASMLFAGIVRHVLENLLRLFRLGLLPEAHGQNALLVVRRGAIQGVLFRDHDSLRLYVPWLEREGLRDPHYEIKPGHSNTLYHDTPEALLFWLQTLVIQVNLRAILESVAVRYGIPAATLWGVVRDATADAIDAIAPDQSLRRLLEHELLRRSDWPLKHIVLPIIARAGGPGSMPFGTGRTRNPLAGMEVGARLDLASTSTWIADQPV